MKWIGDDNNQKFSIFNLTNSSLDKIEWHNYMLSYETNLIYFQTWQFPLKRDRESQKQQNMQEISSPVEETNFADRRCYMKYVNGNYKSVILKR